MLPPGFEFVSIGLNQTVRYVQVNRKPDLAIWGELVKHIGGCHCGQVKYEVEMNLENAISCNCSICMKRGSLLDFVPEANFKLLSGERDLGDYQFNKKRIHHLFCKKCGIMSYANGLSPDGQKMVAINVRCLDVVELGKIKIKEYDGKNH
ncbi:MAG: GFA family protein [Bdellovibrionaceae bacterium]|nr:GFA family protein [Bdellovibrio sp.]